MTGVQTCALPIYNQIGPDAGRFAGSNRDNSGIVHCNRFQSGGINVFMSWRPGSRDEQKPHHVIFLSIADIVHLLFFDESGF